VYHAIMVVQCTGAFEIRKLSHFTTAVGQRAIPSHPVRRHPIPSRSKKMVEVEANLILGSPLPKTSSSFASWFFWKLEDGMECWDGMLGWNAGLAARPHATPNIPVPIRPYVHGRYHRSTGQARGQMLGNRERMQYA
jgi:hypothetical protein